MSVTKYVTLDEFERLQRDNLRHEAALAEDYLTIERLTAELEKANITASVLQSQLTIARGELAAAKALNDAAWSFTHSWINNEVDQDDGEWMDVMEDLTAKAAAVMRLCNPPQAIRAALTKTGSTDQRNL